MVGERFKHLKKREQKESSVGKSKKKTQFYATDKLRHRPGSVLTDAFCCILRFFAVLQIEYVTEPSQLEFLRLLSGRARQRIKYSCKDSVAWGDNNNGFSMSLKIKADNGVEMHAGSSNKFKPKLILDDCSVSKSLFLLLRRRSYIQKKKQNLLTG